MTPQTKRWLVLGAGVAGFAALLKALSTAASAASTVATTVATFTDNLEPIDASGRLMRADAAKAFKSMVAAARAADLSLTASSAYRSTAEQARLYAEYLLNPCAGSPRNPFGVSLPGCFNLASPPGGNSGHERGLSVDINVGSESSAIFRWLTANARRFNFINDGLKFAQREPWHFSYLG